MKFEIHAERKEDGDKKIFYYDNQTNILTNEAGTEFKYPEIPPNQLQEYTAFDRNNPVSYTHLTLPTNREV